MKQECRQREDGHLTRQKLLACAEKLTAQKGFAAVTSKEICQMAGVNVAAVNYHFGSREKLYEAMLYDVHDRIIDHTMLQDLAKSDLPPRQKLEELMEYALRAVERERWTDDVALALNVWLREVFNNTTAVIPIARQIMLVKFPWLMKLFGDYTGRKADDPALYSGILGFMGPLAVLNLGSSLPLNREAKPLTYILQPEFIRQLKTFLFAGLDALRVKN